MNPPRGYLQAGSELTIKYAAARNQEQNKNKAKKTLLFRWNRALWRPILILSLITKILFIQLNSDAAKVYEILLEDPQHFKLYSCENRGTLEKWES